MEKLGNSGNTLYVFDKFGDGASFSNMGRFIANVKLANVSFVLRKIQDVEVLSILGSPTSNMCDVFFSGKAGVSPIGYMEAISKVRGLANMGVAPLRILRSEEAGLMQVLFVIRPSSVSHSSLQDLLNIKEWRCI